jgi:DNA mismatch repair ATPase MutS
MYEKRTIADALGKIPSIVTLINNAREGKNYGLSDTEIMNDLEENLAYLRECPTNITGKEDRACYNSVSSQLAIKSMSKDKLESLMKTVNLVEKLLNDIKKEQAGKKTN